MIGLLTRNGKTLTTLEAVDAFISSKRAIDATFETIKAYRGRLKPFIATFPTIPQDPREIEDYMASLRCSSETRRLTFTVLKGLYKFAQMRYGISNPMDQVGRPRKKRLLVESLTDEEVEDTLGIIDNLRDYALFRLFLDTGIRVGEAAPLEQNHIGENTIRISGKTGEAEVPISHEVRDMLRRLGQERVFVGRFGPINEPGMQAIVRKWLRRAGVSGKKTGPHVLRHTFARMFLMSGGDAISLKNILRHTSLTMTDKYVHLWGADLVAKHRQFTPSRRIKAKPPDERRPRGRPRKLT